MLGDAARKILGGTEQALLHARRARRAPKDRQPGPFPPPPGTAGSRESVLDELLGERVVSGRNQIKPRGVKRKMSNYPLRPRNYTTVE